MNGEIKMPKLVDRRTLCKLLGNVSLSHIIRLDRDGHLGNARIQIGERVVRYDLSVIRKLIADRGLS